VKYKVIGQFSENSGNCWIKEARKHLGSIFMSLAMLREMFPFSYRTSTFSCRQKEVYSRWKNCQRKTA